MTGRELLLKFDGGFWIGGIGTSTSWKKWLIQLPMESSIWLTRSCTTHALLSHNPWYSSQIQWEKQIDPMIPLTPRSSGDLGLPHFKKPLTIIQREVGLFSLFCSFRSFGSICSVRKGSLPSTRKAMVGRAAKILMGATKTTHHDHR